MQLYITPTSPFARMPRIIIIEKGLEHRVEIIPAKTRMANSPYYAINPSGRVPYLVRDDATALEDSALICAWLDHLDGRPGFDLPPGPSSWEGRRHRADPIDSHSSSHCDHPGDNADRDLFRCLRADLNAHRGFHSGEVFRPETPLDQIREHVNHLRL